MLKYYVCSRLQTQTQYNYSSVFFNIEILQTAPMMKHYNIPSIQMHTCIVK